MDAVTAHDVVDHSVKAPERRSISFADEEDKFAFLGTGGTGVNEEQDEAYDDEEQSEDLEDCDNDAGEEEEDEQEACESSTSSRPPRRVQFCDGYEEEESTPSPTSPHPRAAATSVASSRSPRSPLLKKFSPLQDRRVNAILIEALQLVDFTSTELAVIDKAVKRLRDAIHGFALLVDKQVNIIGAESLEERGRVRADIMDLCDGLRTSNALLENTCSRMKKTLGAGKNHIHAHKRKLVGRAVKDIVGASLPSKAGPTTTRTAPGSPLSAASRVPSSPYALRFDTPTSPVPSSPSKKSPLKPPPLFSTAKSPTRVPFASLLRGGVYPEDVAGVSGSYEQTDGSLSPLLPPRVFESVLESIGLAETEFLDHKAVTRVLHEALAGLIARSSALTFLGKAHHRKLLPQYASELAQLVLFDLHVLPQATPSSPVVVPTNSLFDYMSATPFRFDALMSILRVSNASASTSARASSSPASPSASPAKSASPFFRAPAFMTSAAAAAVDTFGVNPFAEQLTRNGGLINGGQVVSLVVGQPAEPARLESAEQTLAMAKLLHELATAECEARAGNRLSLRAPDSRAKEFSRAYLAASKQLLEHEASGGFA